VKTLLNQIEKLSARLRDARAMIQQRDEINQLKDEQGQGFLKAKNLQRE